MHRFITALAASAALAASVPPASAENYVQPYQSEQRGFSVGPGEVLAGLVALGIIAAVLDHDDDPAPVRTQPIPPKKTYKVKPPKSPHHRPRPYALPGHCLRDVTGYGRRVTLYGRHCLGQARIQVASLPKTCLVTVPVRSGRFVGFKSQCLHAHGYRTARR